MPAVSVTPRRIFGLALPALGVLAAMPLYLLLDTAVVGRMLGVTELAALAAGAAIHSSVTTNLTFLSYGTTARSSRLFGQGKRAEAIAEGVQASWIGLGVGILLALLIWAGADLFAVWMTGGGEVGEHTAAWLRTNAFSIPLTLVVMAGNGWMRGIQDTRRPLVFVLAGVIPGAIAIPVFVHYFGLVGSALANVLGMAITATAFLLCLRFEHAKGGGSWQPQPRVMWRQLILGRDLILRSLSFQIAFLSAAGVAARFGTAPLAAHQILLQLWNFITLVLDSLAIAAQTLTGAALGGGSVAVARRVGVKVTRYSVVFGLVLAVIFAAGAEIIPQLFTSDRVVLAALAGPWWLLLILIIAGGVVFALDGVLLGAGDAAFLRTISIASVLLGFLPGVWIAYAVDGGLFGIWCGLLAFILLRLVAVVWRFLSMRWAIIDAEVTEVAEVKGS